MPEGKAYVKFTDKTLSIRNNALLVNRRPLKYYYGRMKTIQRPTFSTDITDNLLSDVLVRLLSNEETPRWNKFISSYHYLGFTGMVGERLRFITVVDEQWIA